MPYGLKHWDIEGRSAVQPVVRIRIGVRNPICRGVFRGIGIAADGQREVGGAFGKCADADGGDAVGYDNAGQAVAPGKSAAADGSDGIVVQLGGNFQLSSEPA